MIWLIGVFLVLPILELAVLLEVGSYLGVWRTLALVILTAVVGAALWKQQGLAVLWSIRDELAREKIPTQALLEGVLVLVAGLLLITPGLLTDTAGFVLLIPTSRRWVLGWITGWIREAVRSGRIQVFLAGGEDGPNSRDSDH